jgi:hypothetical protein
MVDIASLVLRVLKRDFQKQLVNFTSQSDMIDWGRPCNLKTWSKKILAVSGVVAMVQVGMKCTILEKVSMKMMMASKPALVTGSCVMKSMDTCSQGVLGVGRGCRRPAGTCWLALMH